MSENQRWNLNRRQLLRLGLGLGAAGALDLWGGARLAFAQDADPEQNDDPRSRRDKGQKALAFVWLAGGPSQLETFDPLPDQGIETKLQGARIHKDYERLADRLDRLSLIRSLVTKEGEHGRGTYILRTGYAPLPTVARPSVGAAVAYGLKRPQHEIPRHISFLSESPPRGGFLGAELNAFAVGDPAQPLEDLVSPAGNSRAKRRLSGLDLLEKGFRAGRERRVEETQHRALAERAVKVMTSAQMQAFEVERESQSSREAYGDSPFGRSLLAARRLLEVGVPAIEVTLGGWDTHVNNFELNTRNAEILDQGLSAFLDDLAERELAESTLVIVGGEFGRTPRVNAVGGRDHWTKGFSYLIGGGGIQPGRVIGATDPLGEQDPTDPVSPEDLYATVFQALGVKGGQEFVTTAGRPVILNEGKPLTKLL